MKRPMRTYKVEDVTCADCGERLRYIAERWAWVHTTKGVDHAPRPAGTVAR